MKINNDKSERVGQTVRGMTEMLIRPEQLSQIIGIAKSYNAKRLLVFGSSLRNSGKPRDIDLACDGIEGWKLYEFGAELEERLDMPVDIVPLRPSTRLTRYIESRGMVLL